MDAASAEVAPSPDAQLVFTVRIPRSALTPPNGFSRKKLPDRVRDYAVAALAAQHPNAWDAAVAHAASAVAAHRETILPAPAPVAVPKVAKRRARASHSETAHKTLATPVMKVEPAPAKHANGAGANGADANGADANVAHANGADANGAGSSGAGAASPKYGKRRARITRSESVREPWKRARTEPTPTPRRRKRGAVATPPSKRRRTSPPPPAERASSAETAAQSPLPPPPKHKLRKKPQQSTRKPLLTLPRRVSRRRAPLTIDELCARLLARGGAGPGSADATDEPRPPSALAAPRLPLLPSSFAAVAARLPASERAAHGFGLGNADMKRAKYKCRMCGTACMSYWKVDHHMRRAHFDNVALFECGSPNCDAKFATTLSLRRHVARAHEK